MQVTPSSPSSFPLSLSLSSYFQVCGLPGALADGLHRALEAGRGLQLQLVGHGVDLEAVEPERERGKTHNTG